MKLFIVLVIALQLCAALAAAKCKPNFCFVVDHSQSLHHRQINLQKEAMKYVLNKYPPGSKLKHASNTFSAYEYGSFSRRILAPSKKFKQSLKAIQKFKKQNRRPSHTGITFMGRALLGCCRTLGKFQNQANIIVVLGGSTKNRNEGKYVAREISMFRMSGGHVVVMPYFGKYASFKHRFSHHRINSHTPSFTSVIKRTLTRACKKNGYNYKYWFEA